MGVIETQGAYCRTTKNSRRSSLTSAACNPSQHVDTPSGVGDKEIISHDLGLGTHGLGHAAITIPIVLRTEEMR